MMLVDNKYDFGSTVYLKTDPNQYPRIVTGLCVRKGSFTYELVSGSCSSWHYEYEMSEEKDVLMKSENS